MILTEVSAPPSAAVPVRALAGHLRLGSGVMPFRAIRQRGIPICLGTV